MSNELPVLPNIHQCGDCTMCCKTMGVEELSKKPNVWCPHCDIGRGCKIYDDRPPTCRSFDCMWLYSNWPEDLRPDRCHVVMAATLDGKRFVANVDPTRPNAAGVGMMGKMLRTVVKKVDVIVVVGNQRRIWSVGEKRRQEILRVLEGSDEVTWYQECDEEL